MANKKFFNVTQKRSSIGASFRQKEALRCLGLRKIRHTVKVEDSPAHRGQMRKVQHLITVCREEKSS